MSKFETKIMMVEAVTDHPNADRLSIVKLFDYTYKIVSAKLEDGSDRYKAGDWVIYVQADSVVPEYLLKRGFWDEKNNKGILGGKLGNRVKPIVLRGVLSEGILYPVHGKGDSHFIENETFQQVVQYGDDVSEFLGTTKYEPVIPTNMAGDVLYVGQHNLLKYDIENSKKWPGALNRTGEQIVVTEKLHGTFCGVGYLPKFEHEELFHVDGIPGSFVVFSKGLGEKGLVFKNNENNVKSNLYVRTALENTLFEKMSCIIDASTLESGAGLFESDARLFLLGEIFGRGVQDLHYGLQKPAFRGFEIAFSNITDSISFVHSGDDWKKELFAEMEIEQVPVLGIVNTEEEILPFISGKSTYGDNIREGVVGTPEYETYIPELGRVILKFVSEDYLNRKNGTEYQ